MKPMVLGVGWLGGDHGQRPEQRRARGYWTLRGTGKHLALWPVSLPGPLGIAAALLELGQA